MPFTISFSASKKQGFRLRRLWPIRFGLCLCVLVCLLAMLWNWLPEKAAAQTDSPTKLELGQVIERELAGGEVHDYQINPAVGQYLYVVVDQRDVDLVVTLFGPDSKQLAQFDIVKLGAEPIFFIAEAPGAYLLRLRPAAAKAPSGYYAINIEEMRIATTQDIDRITAERAAGQCFSEGEQLGMQSTAESWRKAVQKFEEALQHWQTIGNRRGVAYALNRLGWAYDNLNEKQRALDYLNRSLAIAREIKDRFLEVTALHFISKVYLLTGKQPEALELLNQMLPLAQALKSRTLEANASLGLGMIAFTSGRNQQALDHLSRAAQLWRDLGNRDSEVATLNALGLLYNLLGLKDDAARSFKRATELRQAARSSGDDAITSDQNRRAAENAYSEGIRLYSQGTAESWQRAVAEFAEAARLWQVVGEREAEAATLAVVSSLYLSLGEKQKARDAAKQAFLLSQTIGNRAMEGSVLTSLGEICFSLGENESAFDYLNRAIPLLRAAGDRYGEALARYHLARTERDRGQLLEACTQIEAALEIIESLRIKLVSPQWRVSFSASVHGNYEFYIDLLMSLHRLHPTKEHDAAALQASERARARSLLESLVEARANIRRGIAPPLLERERALHQQMNAKAEDQLRLLNGKHTPEEVEAVKQELDKLSEEMRKLEDHIRETSPSYAALNYPIPLSLTEIQQQVLDPNTLLLEYALGEERSYLWAVTPTTIASFELPKRAEVEGVASQVYELLTANNRSKCNETWEQKEARVAEAKAQYPAAAARLSRMLFGPVATRLGGKRLLIVADGMLQYVPFAALPEPESGSAREREKGKSAAIRHSRSFTPLVLKHEIVSLPSASTIAVLRRELLGRKPASKALAVLADPVFGKDDNRLSLLANQPDSRVAGSDKKSLPCAETGGARPLKRLLYSGLEARSILSLVPADQRLEALGFRANRAMATSAELSQYRIVHFATHGRADTERPELSTLVLSLMDERGQEQEGYLRAHELYNLNLPAELVVLSACETGLGKQIRGEGLIGLTRGFMYAGAKRVMVSLWDVNDAATADLMKRFYRGVLKNRLRPAAALRAAQIEMWRTPHLSSPFFWAGFVLQGEWRE